MKIVFITFGSHENYIKAGHRLKAQAEGLNIFTETILYTPEYLKNDIGFWSMHSKFIESNKRGYGYWLWKPYIIKKTMENMSDGDILLYLDAGCELAEVKKKKLLELINIVKTDKLIGNPNGHIERKWNKMDLVEKINMNKSEYMNTSQREGGINLFLVCTDTIKLVNEWYELCCDYHNIDDTPSILQNAEDFREHRHDQSVFSLLTKKYNLFSKFRITDGIYANRNRTGTTRLVPSRNLKRKLIFF